MLGSRQPYERSEHEFPRSPVFVLSLVRLLKPTSKYNWKPARCQATTVLGVTRMRGSCHQDSEHQPADVVILLRKGLATVGTNHASQVKRRVQVALPSRSSSPRHGPDVEIIQKEAETVGSVSIGTRVLVICCAGLSVVLPGLIWFRSTRTSW